MEKQKSERLIPEGQDLAYDILYVLTKSGVTVKEAERILDKVRSEIPSNARLV